MSLRLLISLAKAEGASDLHVESGLSPVLRVRGSLKTAGEPVPPSHAMEWARELIGGEAWPDFLIRGSFDLSRTIEGLRCRINILQTARGVGFAVRLLPAFEPTIEGLNLHPEFRGLVEDSHGLLLVAGPTGCGKSSTLAALINTINAAEARHIVTIENPVEFSFRPRRSFIRQREVGRDTPSFEQALLDSLREDPDVLVVGELREPETMRLTLNAAETGHLVLATVHSSNCVEALQRIINAFPPEVQSNVAAQMADCLIGVLAQRLVYRPQLNICVPECEVLRANLAVKHFIRTRDFFKIISSIETGAEHGMWSFARYRGWLEKRPKFHVPDRAPAAAAEEEEFPEVRPASMPASPARPVRAETTPAVRSSPTAPPEGGRIEIEPTESFDKILKRP